MKARLQFLEDEPGHEAWFTLGDVRSNRREYTVEPITGYSRKGELETIGYRVRIECNILTLNQKDLGGTPQYELFLADDTHYFRLHFYDDSLIIALGNRRYTISYNARPSQNIVENHLIIIEFIIGEDEYPDYSIPVAI
jgi:hypothetical protein